MRPVTNIHLVALFDLFVHIPVKRRLQRSHKRHSKRQHSHTSAPGIHVIKTYFTAGFFSTLFNFFQLICFVSPWFSFLSLLKHHFFPFPPAAYRCPLAPTVQFLMIQLIFIFLTLSSPPPTMGLLMFTSQEHSSLLPSGGFRRLLNFFLIFLSCHVSAVCLGRSLGFSMAAPFCCCWKSF